MTLLDTSVLVGVERRDPLVLATVADLLAEGQLAVAAVTVHELLRSPSLPPAWRAFWRDLLETVPVLPLDRTAAEAAAVLWQGLAAQGRRPDVADALIAGTALAAEAELLTADDAFADQLGARLLRTS